MIYDNIYSGVASITRAFENKGHAACPYDIINDENGQNMNTDMGFLNAVNLIMRLKWPNQSMVWFAIVCSSWVWISRSTTKRTPWAPCGDTNISGVIMGNEQCVRMVLLILFAASRMISYGIEQPASSIIVHHPRFMQLKDVAKKHPDLITYEETHLYMGSHGAATPKPSKLFTSKGYAKSLDLPLPTHRRKTSKDNATVTVTRSKATGKGRSQARRGS